MALPSVCMKILMLTDRMEAGGAETHIAQLIRGLREMGVEVWLMSGGGRVADELAAEGIPVIDAVFSKRAPLKSLRTRRTICALVKREHFDILHAHARIPALLLGGIERLGCATVVTVHAHFRSGFWLSRLSRWGSRTIAVSEDLRTYVCETYGVAAERVSVIPNGVDCSRFSPTSMRKGAPRILFVSRLDADCSLGAELLCELAPSLLRRFSGVTLTIAGGGSEYERLFLRAEEINRRLGRAALHVTGWVHDMPALLRKHEIVVGVSRAAIEAGACGCAVILCGNEGYGGILDREGIRRAAGSNFCARGEALPTRERLEKELVSLLEQPSLRYRLGEELRRAIEGEFGAERMCRRTLALYQKCLVPKPRWHLTVGGYFGCGNLGDDAILLGLLEALRDALPNVSVTALTGSPRRDRRRFGIQCINRKNPFLVFREILHADLFLLGGGSLLQNLTSNRSLVYYLTLLRLSHLLGTPAAVFAAGIGPLLGDRTSRRVMRTLNRCRYISLRESGSLRQLTAMGVDAGKLHLGGDPAFLLPAPPKSRGAALLSAHGIPTDARYLCVVLRGGEAFALTRSLLLTAVRTVCKRNRLVPLLAVFDELHDGTHSLEALPECGGRLILLREPGDAMALFLQCETVVTMRLHALILATCCATPTLGISADARDGKIREVANATGQDFLSAETLSVAGLVEAMERCLCSRRSRTPLLLDASAEMRKRLRADLVGLSGVLFETGD